MSLLQNWIMEIIKGFSSVPDPVSGIRCLFDPWIRNPGSRMGKKSGSGSGIRDEQPGSYFRELRNLFLGLEYLNSLMRIRDRIRYTGFFIGRVVTIEAF
jgi:hypothetical protein